MANVAEFIQCDSRNYTVGRQGNRISKIVVHYTGTEASAHNNLLYFSRSSAGASAHYFIDSDGAIRQSVSEGDTAWHAGHWATNLCSVGIEVVSGGADYTEAQIVALSQLVADIRSRCGVTADNVIRHYDVTGKLCPAPYVNASKWAALHARICGGTASAGSGTAGASVEGDVADLARRVIDGEFGNGDARKAALGDRYSEVQAEVNRILGGGSTGATTGSGGATADIDDLARRVIAGEFGNGDARKEALGQNCSAVQARVNEMLGCGSSGGASASGGVDIEALARAVINGGYGNGEERRQRLGVNYDAAQRRVNEILS